MAGHTTVGIAVWMATWWLSEAVPIYATALLPLALLPLAGASSMRAAAAPYAHPLIFLFLGGFLIARAMERWGLHRRSALLALRIVGERPAAMVGGFMAISALLSMWVSNTATAIMMLPVAQSVIALVAERVAPDEAPGEAPRVRPFAVALLLGIAYAASIGGVGTPIGTPPNLLLLSFVETELHQQISFVRWMAVTLPLLLVFLPATWWLLTQVLYPAPFDRVTGGAGLIRQELRRLGPLGAGERATLCAFLGAALLWITRPLLVKLQIGGLQPLAGLTDTVIAMLAALALFVTPVARRPLRFALDWESAASLPWGILILFGGGLSLASAIQANGVSSLLGNAVAAFGAVPSLLTVAVVITGVAFLTELTSNTATTAAVVPILAAVAPGMGLDPLLLIVPAAISASCAFMLPVATPPNAVVFASGLIPAHEMSRAGLWLHGIGIVLVTALTYATVLPLLAR